MGSISDYLENELLDHVIGQGTRNYSVPTIYVALGTSADDTGLTGEPVGNGYARVAHSSWNTAATRAIDNNGVITFPSATGSWGTMASYAIFDASTAGNMLAWGDLAAGKSVVNGNTPSIADQGISITFSAGGISNYLALELLDHVFGNGSYTAPTTIYVALSTATIDDTTTGTTITEPSNNYSRVSASSSNWGTASSGALDNTSALTFATPSGSWGSITYGALIDAATLGQILFYSTATPNQTPDNGDTVEYAIGAWDVSMT